MNEIQFTSGSDHCSAWHLQAAGDAFASPGGRPCVVMAPGFGGTRDSSLLGYAEGFAAAGLDVLLFDYRGFGGSGGSPRQLVSVRRQRQDYHAAVAAARQLPGVDPDRIILWGVSYAGGHVVVVAARDKRVAATISLTPAMDGVPVLIQLGRNGGVSHLVRATGNGLRDALRALTGRPPHLVPVVGEPGSNAIIPKAGGQEAFTAIAGPSWRNELCARTALGAALNRPIRFASRVRCPLLVQVGSSDSICPPPAGRRAAAKAGSRAELREYPVDHLDVYAGAWQERALADQLDFLGRAAPAPAAPGQGGHGRA
ncbi:MAG: alpha/beta fold hydrolase [Streptosporangiaceae bacterium]